MHYFIDEAENVFAFASEADAPKSLARIDESDALSLAAGPSPAVDYPALIAAERYKREGTGVTVDGFVIETTRDGQALIAGAAVSAIIDPTYKCNWKTGAGFTELTAAKLIAIATSVRAHVQACFDRELALLRAVEAGNYSNNMLAEGWPDSVPDPIAGTGPAPEHQ